MAEADESPLVETSRNVSLVQSLNGTEMNDKVDVYFNNASSLNGTTLSCGPQRRSPEPGTYPYYISLYVFPILFLIGTFGNLMIMVVLKKLKQRSNAFLMAMAFADLLFFIPMFVISLNAYDFLAVDENFLKFSYHSHTPIVAFANWFSTASNWFIICIAIERLLAIRHPLRVNWIWKGHFSKVMIIAVFVFSAAVQTPRFFGYEVMETEYENKTVFCYALQLSHINYFMIRVSRTVVPFVTIIIPMVGLTVVNVMLVYSIRRSRMNVKKLGYVSVCTQQMMNEKKVTKLVLAIVIAFFLFNIPSGIVAILIAVVKNNAFLLQLYGLPVQTTNHLVVLSKVINFFLYFCCCSKFRKAFLPLWQTFRNKHLWLSISSRTNSIVLTLRRLSMN